MVFSRTVSTLKKFCFDVMYIVCECLPIWGDSSTRARNVKSSMAAQGAQTVRARRPLACDGTPASTRNNGALPVKNKDGKLVLAPCFSRRILTMSFLSLGSTTVALSHKLYDCAAVAFAHKLYEGARRKPPLAGRPLDSTARHCVVPAYPCV